MKKPTCEWVDLRHYWDKIESLAHKRDEQKLHYESTKNWNVHNSTHFIGLCGEFVVAIQTDMDVDTELRKAGDPGYDFKIKDKTYSVKSTTYWKDPHLKEYLRPKHFCDFYLLVGVDIDDKRGKIFGWCNTKDIQSAKIVDYGHGEQRSVPWNQLRKF